MQRLGPTQTQLGVRPQEMVVNIIIIDWHMDNLCQMKERIFRGQAAPAQGAVSSSGESGFTQEPAQLLE